jgi:hypothetical protein
MNTDPKWSWHGPGTWRHAGTPVEKATYRPNRNLGSSVTVTQGGDRRIRWWVSMDERQKLLDDLARHLTVRKLTTDEQARDAINETIRDIEERLAQIDQSTDQSRPR